MPLIINNYRKLFFYPFIDNYIGAAINFNTLFDLLYIRYFLKVAFKPIYLSGYKIYIFTDSLEMVGFIGSTEGLRPSTRYRQKVILQKKPTNRVELDAIIWITPFLRIFIPGRVEYIIRLKKVYLKEEAIELESGNGKSIRKKWIEKDIFNWGPE